jgi:hypothetical protein
MCTRPLNPMRINRDRWTVAMRLPKWSVITVIFGAAAVAASFVAGMDAHDASPISSGAIRSAASSSMPAAKSGVYAVTFPEANRAVKGHRLPVPIPDTQVGVAIKRGAKDEDGGSLRSRAPRETERKPVIHCEPVGSPLSDSAVRNIPSRSCLARLGTLPQYTLLESVRLRAS